MAAEVRAWIQRDITRPAGGGAAGIRGERVSGSIHLPISMLLRSVHCARKSP
jgi:hypothetical protein